MAILKKIHILKLTSARARFFAPFGTALSGCACWTGGRSFHAPQAPETFSMGTREYTSADVVDRRNALLPSANFRRAMPEDRLGLAHDTYQDYLTAIDGFVASKKKEYTLIVVTESGRNGKERRLLLGMKNRGFGKGLYNSFGGKFDSPNETPAQCASRELREETNIEWPPEKMDRCRVGTQRYTFEDSDVEMVMHVFRINVASGKHNIRGCEEITPVWFEDWFCDAPLDGMFADDTIWLTELLSAPVGSVSVDGWYHFRANAQQTNAILHRYVEVQRFEPKRTLEERLFHAIHSNDVQSPSVKEFKESFAFCNAVKKNFGRKSFDVVIDVAGGHGALGALLMMTTDTAKDAVVIDPADVGNGGVQRAWGSYLQGKILRYRHECLRTGLPDELESIIVHRSVPPNRVLVVACHACQHLSEETLEIARQFHCHAAVMPCCQKDTSPGSSWKSTSKNLNVPVAVTMDVLLAGKMMASKTYDVRMKCIDAKITPQNRIILCRALDDIDDHNQKEQAIRAHTQLKRAYQKAHASKGTSKRAKPKFVEGSFFHLTIGFVCGAAFAAATLFRRK